MSHVNTTPSARRRGEIARLYGVPIIFGPQRLAVSLVYAAFFWFQNSDAPTRFRFEFTVGSVVVVILAVGCHEFGHGLVAKMYSREGRSPQVNPCCFAPIFGEVSGRSAPVKPQVTLAGPAANFLLSGIAAVLLILDVNFAGVGMWLQAMCSFSIFFGLISLACELSLSDTFEFPSAFVFRSINFGDWVKKPTLVVASRVAGGTTIFVSAFSAFLFWEWLKFEPSPWLFLVGALVLLLGYSTALVMSSFIEYKTHSRTTL